MFHDWEQASCPIFPAPFVTLELTADGRALQRLLSDQNPMSPVGAQRPSAAAAPRPVRMAGLSGHSGHFWARARDTNLAA